MRKIWLIARREYLATVRTKAFLISVVMMPILMTAGAGISIVSKRFDDQGEKKFAVVDRTPGSKVWPILEVAVARRNAKEIVDKKTGARIAPLFILEKIEPSAATPDAIDRQRLELSERVRQGDIVGFLEIGPKAMQEASALGGLLSALGGKKKRDDDTIDPAHDPAATRYQSRPTAAGAVEFYRWAAVEIALATRLGLTSQKPEVRDALLQQRAPVVMLGLSHLDPRTGAIVDDEGVSHALATAFIGVGCIALMFMIVMVVGTPLMQGVLEEKMQRISEVLLGSVSPMQLMAGKLVGGLGVALTLTAFYLGGTLWGLHHYGYADHLPDGLVAWFIFYQCLALLMYGSLFVAIGAACTDIKEPQILMLPVLMPAMLPLFLIGPILQNPGGDLARGASLFPPCTPMIMVARQGMGAEIAWWETALGVALVLLTTTFCLWAAGRIFRVGILLQGKGASFTEMVRWVIRG